MLKKEFLLNLIMFRFAVGTILCVVFMAVFTSILLKDYQQRLENYNRAVADDAAELRKARVYKNIKPIIYRRPEMLSIFSEGLEKRLGKASRKKSPDTTYMLQKGFSAKILPIPQSPRQGRIHTDK